MFVPGENQSEGLGRWASVALRMKLIVRYDAASRLVIWGDRGLQAHARSYLLAPLRGSLLCLSVRDDCATLADGTRRACEFWGAGT